MSFLALVPQNKPVGAPRIRTIKTKGGEITLALSIPSTTMAKAKWFEIPAALTVRVGTGADLGKLQIVESADEPALKVSVLKHTAVIRLPRQDWMPDIEFAPFEIDVRCTEKQITVDMPGWAYDQERQRAVKLARKQNAAGLPIPEGSRHGK